jgi:hypothetical protein
VNTDGSHSYEVVRRSGNQAFDRAWNKRWKPRISLRCPRGETPPYG